ncbi:hypothetical protein OKW34_000101 [Paraburkholderia youngii]|uniref:hypothetical protein n=1 Tax=Paraburkholderia youngii TaxID=2782701 RepID=UPI003D256D26
MSTRKSFRTPRKQAAGARSRTLLLPMPRDDAAKLVLRTRLALDRLRNGEADRRLINELSQIVLLTNFISEAGHSDLELAWLERVEGDLAGVLVQADATGIWVVPEDLIGDVTKVVNEYDRALSQTRLAVIVDACNRLERLIEANLKHQLAPVAGADNPLIQTLARRCWKALFRENAVRPRSVLCR